MSVGMCVDMCVDVRVDMCADMIEMKLWLMVSRERVNSCEGSMSDPGGYDFFGIGSVTEMDRGVCMRMRAQGLRYRACEGRDGLVSMGA